MDTTSESVKSIYYLEQAVVGGCLLEPRRALDVADWLHEKHFEDGRWGMAYRLIVEATRLDRAVDGLIISDDIFQRWGVRFIDENGVDVSNPDYWRGVYSMLADAVTSGVPALVEQYALRVRQAWLKRQLAYVAEMVLDHEAKAVSPEETLELLVDQALDLSREYHSSGAQS